MNESRKVVVITGGAQGIGKGIVRYLLQTGMNTVIADIDDEAGRECLDEYRHLGDIKFLHTDVSDELSVKQCIDETGRCYGRIDALINNAAIADPAGGPVEALDLVEWNRIIGINLTGSFLTVKHAVPHLRNSRGVIINIASTRALQSEPNTEAYAASKGGIVAFTHALAISLGNQVRVNCISPGWIEVSEWKKSKNRKKPLLTSLDHRQHPAGRVGEPGDIAAMAAFLISDAAGFITGQNFIVDGGMTKKMIYLQE